MDKRREKIKRPLKHRRKHVNERWKHTHRKMMERMGRQWWIRESMTNKGLIDERREKIKKKNTKHIKEACKSEREKHAA